MVLAMQWLGCHWSSFGFIRKTHSVVGADSGARVLAHDGTYDKPACLRASHFGRCWTVFDHFSFPLECNSLPCLLHLGIWDLQEVEFLGKDLARLRGRIWCFTLWRTCSHLLEPALLCSRQAAQLFLIATVWRRRYVFILPFDWRQSWSREVKWLSKIIPRKNQE